MVTSRDAGAREPTRLAPRRPGRHDLGLQLRGHRLGHGRRAAAALRRDPVRGRGLPGRAAAAAAGRVRGGCWPRVGAFMSLGQFGLLYVSMAAGMPPGLAALVLQAQVIFTDRDRGRGAARAADRRPGRRASRSGTVGLVVVGLGRGGHVTAAALALCLLAALSWGIGNVVSRAAEGAGRPVAHGLVGGRRAGAAARAVARSSTDRRRGRRRAGRVLVAGGAVDGVHRRAGVARRLRDLQLAAGAQPVGVRRPVGAARPGGRDGVGLAAARPVAERGRDRRRRTADRRRAGRAAPAPHASRRRGRSDRPRAGRPAPGTASRTRSRARPRRRSGSRPGRRRARRRSRGAGRGWRARPDSAAARTSAPTPSVSSDSNGDTAKTPCSR